MIELNPEYERILSPENIDKDCDKIAHQIDVVGLQIKEMLKIAGDIEDGRVGLYNMAVTKYLQLLKSMTKHFVEDEHYCYFDDMYSPEYTMQWIYEAIQKAAIKREEGQVTTCVFPSVSRLNEVKHDIDAESQALLVGRHKEILQSECYEDYGYPSYVDNKY